MRGGGGNFGVVTSFTFQSHPIGENGIVYAGPVLYDIDDTAEVMRWYREFQPAQPEDLSGWIALITIPPAPPFPESLWGLSPAPSSGATPDRMTGQTRRSSQSEASALRWLSHSGDAVQHADHRVRRTLSRRSAVVLASRLLQGDHRRGHRDPPRLRRAAAHRTLDHALYPIDGAAARVPSSATAFAYRDGGWAGVIVGVDPDPANREALTSWTKDYWEALHPTSAGGAYVNFLMDDEGQDRVKASYRDNYARLAQVKRRYDPHNLFHVNQNIRSGD